MTVAFSYVLVAAGSALLGMAARAALDELAYRQALTSYRERAGGRHG